jgi:hypothetical protein
MTTQQGRGAECHREASWAQLVKMRLKPGKDVAWLGERLRAIEQPGSGLLRTLVMRDQKDPHQVYVLVVFDSEERARARERDPRRQEGLRAVEAMLADRLAGPREFVDLTVAEEWTGFPDRSSARPRHPGVGR